MAVFENGEGRTGRDILNKKRRKYATERAKRQHFADNYKPSGKDVAEEHVHGMLKQKVAAERSHELARMVIANNLDQAKILVSNGADPNLEDWMDFDRTALHYAAMFGSLESVTWLVESAGADPAVEDSTHATPLALAEQRGRPEVAAYLSEWTTERLRALAEARSLAKEEYKARELKTMARNNARQSLLFLGNITKTGMKHQYAGPEIDQVQSGQEGDEENLVQAILALKKSPMGNKLNFMELARMLRPKVGDIWSERVWDAMRAHVAAPTPGPEGPEDPEGDDDDEDDEMDEDLIGEALAELGKYLGGAFEKVTMSLHADDGPEDDDDDDDGKSNHGDEIEAQRRIHAKKAELPDNETAQKWRHWCKRRAQRRKELLPVGFIGWEDPDAIQEEEQDQDNAIVIEQEMVVIEEDVEEKEIQPDGTVMTRWVKKKRTILQAKIVPKKMIEEIVPPTKPVIDESARAFAAMALQCLLKGSALNANMLKRTLGTWAVPTIQGRFARWKNNVETRQYTRSVLTSAIQKIEKKHLIDGFNQWNAALADVREFVRKRNLLWRTISYPTRKALERAFDKMKDEPDEWEMEESLDGGKTWITRIVKKGEKTTTTTTTKKNAKGVTTRRKKPTPKKLTKKTIQKKVGVKKIQPKGKKIITNKKKKIITKKKKKIKKDGIQSDTSNDDTSSEEETEDMETAAILTNDSVAPKLGASGNGWWNNNLAKTVLPTLNRPDRKEEEEKEITEENENKETDDDEEELMEKETKNLEASAIKTSLHTSPVVGSKKKKLITSPIKKKQQTKKKPISKKKKKVVSETEESSSEESSSEESSSEEETDSESEDEDSSSSSSPSSSSSASESEMNLKQQAAVDELKKELMLELKKSRQESEELRKTVEEQQSQFGEQQDIITRQQAQITGLLVAKEAAEVARKRQEQHLLKAQNETTLANEARRQALEDAHRDAAEQARLLRKRAVQMLTGVATSKGHAFDKAMEKRKEDQTNGMVQKEEDDIDDLIEALRIDDEAAGITPKTTARGRDAEDEASSSDEDHEEEDLKETHVLDESNESSNNDGLIKVVRRVKKKGKIKQKKIIKGPNVILQDEEKHQNVKNVEQNEEAAKEQKRLFDIMVQESLEQEQNNQNNKEQEIDQEIETTLSATEQTDVSSELGTSDDDDDQEEEEEDLDENGEPKTEEGKKKRRKRLAKRTRRKKKRKTALNNLPGGESSENAKKKIRAKLDTSGVQIKRGNGFKMPKYHVRQFRHPREMEMALLQAEKTIEDLSVKLEKTTDALIYTQDELMLIKDESEEGARSALESGTDTEDVNGIVMYTGANGLPTASRQEQVQLKLDGITAMVAKTLNKVGSSRKGTPRSNTDNSSKEDKKKKKKDKQTTDEKLSIEEAQKYERQLEKWVQEKLDRWESDTKFRKKRMKKFKTKELFEKSLRAKTQQQLKANS